MIADTSHKLILFADDLILYVLNHKSVFPSILKKKNSLDTQPPLTIIPHNHNA